MAGNLAAQTLWLRWDSSAAVGSAFQPSGRSLTSSVAAFNCAAVSAAAGFAAQPATG